MNFMSDLEMSLHRFLMIDGVSTAALIDVATGMVVQAAGEGSPGLPDAAASVADEVRAARAMLGPSRPAGDLDEITVVTARRLHLSRILQGHPGEGLLLFVDLDRARANVALASLRVGQLAPTVLA
jgi:hypothetical protein